MTLNPRFVINTGAALACVLVCVLVTEYLRDTQGPYFGPFHHDPDYAYLLNSATMICGGKRNMYMHPGTTVHIFGAVVFRITSWFRDKPFCSDIVADSEHYLVLLSRGISILLGLSIWLAAYIVARSERSKTAALLAVAAPLSVPAIWESTIGYAPEPFLLGFSLICGALILDMSRAGAQFGTRWIIGISTAFACAVMTKITFAPFLVLLFLINPLRKRIMALCLTGSLCILLAIPIWSQIWTALNWYLNLATHTGQYGHGQVGFVDASSFWNNTIEIWYAAPIVYLVLFIVVARLFLRDKYPHSGIRWSVLGVWVLAAFAITVLVAKHFAVRYLIPVVGVSPFLAIAVLRTLPDQLRSLVYASCMIIALGALLVSYQNGVTELRTSAESNQDAAYLRTQASSLECEIVEYYRTSSRTSAMIFGDSFSGRRFREAIKNHDPTFLVFNVFNRRFQLPDRWVPPGITDKLINEHACLIGLLDLQEWQNMPFSVDLIERRGQLSLFRITGDLRDTAP